MSGTFENPGPDLTDYVLVIVTAYDENGRVLGWGWQHEIDPTYLATGSHDFDVEIKMPEIVADLGLGIYAYKIQLFSH